MKKINTLLAAGLLGVSLFAGSLTAQDNTTPPMDPTVMPPPPRTGPGPAMNPPTRPEAPVGREIRPQAPVRPDRPALPERPALPADLKALIEKFNAARETYLTDQKALFEQLRTAAEADRAAIREKIQANREEFLTATKTLREDIRTQMQNLRDQLPTRKEVIDNAGPRPGSRPGVN